MVFPSVPVIVAVPALMAAVPGAFAPIHFTLVGLVTISFSLGGQVRTLTISIFILFKS